MTVPFRLGAGDSAPVQQTSTTCGSASLTVARMLADPAFAAWIGDGIPRTASPGRDADSGTQAERFAAYEQVVAGRTNSLVGPAGALQLPWPRALGTPPWGARRELEFGAAAPRVHYGVTWLRHRGTAGLERTYAALRHRVHDGRPALLYVGNALLPRHVVLALPAAESRGLDVYEPSVGRVIDLSMRSFADRSLRLGGWDVPWALVWPRSSS